MSISQSFTPSFARNDGPDWNPVREFSGTASLLIGASQVNRTGLSLVSDPTPSLKLERKRQRDSEAGSSPSAGEEEQDDSGSDYDPNPPKAAPAKRTRHNNYGRSAVTRNSYQVQPSSPVPSTVSPRSYESSGVTDLSGHSASAPYPATSPASFAPSAGPHSSYIGTWQSYHRATPPYSGAIHGTSEPGLYDSGMSTRFADERNAGIAPSSINRTCPPPAAAATDFIQRSHQPEAMVPIRPGPVQKKRGKLPEEAISVMKAWLFANTHHPYPSDSQKREMCNQTGLSPQQVSNWFINARRRILKRANDDWPAQQSQQSDSLSPELPPARIPYDRVPTELPREDVPPSPVFTSNSAPPASYYTNPPPPQQQRNSPPQSYTATPYGYSYSDPPAQGYSMPPPPHSYSFGRQSHPTSAYALSREPPAAESYARYSSGPNPHYRSSPYLRTPTLPDERPASAQSSRSLDH